MRGLTAVVQQFKNNNTAQANYYTLVTYSIKLIIPINFPIEADI